MKRNITLSLLILLLLNNLPVFAAGPTVPASNLSFSSIDGTSFSMTFTRGNGASRIVVMKEAGAVTGVPADGIEYAANSQFGTAGSEFTATGEYVVYKGAGNTITVTKLKPNTVYHVSVFEYNGSGAATQYLVLSLNGSQATINTPTLQATSLNFTTVIGNSVKLNLTKGNGARRLVIARKGAAVNAVPEDLKTYSYSSDFGSGSVINGDNYVVYAGSGAQMDIDKLEPATTYHFAVFEYNGSVGPMYLRPGAVISVTTNAGPTVATKSVTFSDIDGSRLTMGFTAGNGAHQLIIARKNAPVTAVPVNGATYTANAAFGQGTQIAPGEFVLNTTADTRTFTNLDPQTVYHFRVYEFDITAGGQTYYLTSAYAEKSQSTALPPTTQASALNFINVTGTAATLKFTSGNGSYRLSIIKEGSPVDANPADLVKYATNGVFGSGAQVSPGNYALSNSNGSSVNITNLTPGKTYHVAVFEFNGQNFPVYMRPAATSSISLPAQPTQPATAFYVSFVEGNEFRTNWSSGNGSRRVVIAKKGSAVTAVPVDGTTYTANSHFGQGQQVAPGEFIIYDGAFNIADAEDLEIGATYHFAVFEYNPSSTGPDYLTTNFLTGTGTALSAPTLQVTAISATGIQSTQATFSFTKGNGAGRIFLMRENAPVNVQPQDLVSYTANSIFGNMDLGAGNYIVYKTIGTGGFTVSNLAPSTVYHVAAFEYNGSSGPVYLRPAGTYSFTTAAGTGVVTPTVAASNPLLTGIDGNKLNFNWTSGNGTNRIVVMKQGSAVSFVPANGTVYTANSVFGTGTDLGSGQYVVFNNNGSAVSVTGLAPGVTYHYAVFEFNGTGANTRYLTSSSLVFSGTTAGTPPSGSTGGGTLAGNQSISINWTSGPGTGRLVVMREGSAVSAVPANLSVYPANSVFGNGAQIGSGQFVVYAGTGSSVLVTGLTPNKTYHFKIFDFNGTEAPVYNTANALTGSATTTSALPVKWLYFTVKENNNEAVLEWGTSNEQNAFQFVVERSVDNMHFVAIDSVQAKGSAGNNYYRVADKTKPAATVYYRIRQVDANGRYEYSKLVPLAASGKKAGLNIYPNPVQDMCRIQLPQGMQSAAIVVYDMKGVQVRTMQVQNGQLLNLGNLAAGNYNVIIRGEEKLSTRIIKK